MSYTNNITPFTVLYDHIVEDEGDTNKLIQYFGHLARPVQNIFRGVSLDENELKKGHVFPRGCSWTYDYIVAKTFAERAEDNAGKKNDHQVLTNNEPMHVIDLRDALNSIRKDMTKEEYIKLDGYLDEEQECINVYRFVLLDDASPGVHGELFVQQQCKQ